MLISSFLKKHKLNSTIDLKIFNKYRRDLENYRWPGNVRELENFIEKFAVLSKDYVKSTNVLEKLINDMYNFGNEYFCGEEENNLNTNKLTINIGTLEDMQKEIIEKIRMLYPYENKASMAKRLNICRTTLWKMQKEDRLKIRDEYKSQLKF